MKVITRIKNILNLAANPLGLQVERHFGTDLELKQILRIVEEQEINMLLDVGANTGQYAMSMLKLGYKGAVISFEPLRDAYDILKANQARYANWIAYDRTAVGDYCGKTMINISGNSFSSSILPINETHSKAAPDAKYIGESETSIITLDSVFSAITDSSHKIFLKIDTQGFEDRVLAGAAESLKKIKLVQLELSLVPLYHGSKTIDWMLPYLKGFGFDPVFFLPTFSDRTTGIIQQLDGVFINSNR